MGASRSFPPRGHAIPLKKPKGQLASSGRLGQVLLACVAIGLALLPYTLSRLVSADRYARTWQAYDVRAMTPVFADLRGVTAPLRCYRDIGLEVYDSNPCDPWQRRYNYPRIWLQLAHLGVDESHTQVLGFALAALFIGAAIHFAGLSGWIGVLGMAPLLLSPPMALIVERGNNDLVVFLLLYAAALASARAGPSRFLTHGLLLFSAVLKLFPCFAFVALLQRRSFRCVAAFAVVCALFGIYLLVSLGDLERIDRATGSPIGSAYGVQILIDRYSGHLGALIGPERLSWVRWGLLVLATGCGFAVGVSKQRWLASASLPAPSAVLTGFQAGAAIFIGTYFLDNHYYYRLVHLLLCVPFLARLVATGSPLVRCLGLGSWLAAVLVFWGEFFEPGQASVLEEWAGLGLVGALAAWIGATILEEDRSAAAEHGTDGSTGVVPASVPL